jgi:soluble cytochrome b562
MKASIYLAAAIASLFVSSQTFSQATKGPCSPATMVTSSSTGSIVNVCNVYGADTRSLERQLRMLIGAKSLDRRKTDDLVRTVNDLLAQVNESIERGKLDRAAEAENSRRALAKLEQTIRENREAIAESPQKLYDLTQSADTLIATLDQALRVSQDIRTNLDAAEAERKRVETETRQRANRSRIESPRSFCSNHRAYVMDWGISWPSWSITGCEHNEAAASLTLSIQETASSRRGRMVLRYSDDQSDYRGEWQTEQSTGLAAYYRGRAQLAFDHSNLGNATGNWASEGFLGLPSGGPLTLRRSGASR